MFLGGIKNDFPVWDNGGIPFEIEDEILKLEDNDGIDYYDDIVEENYYGHKIGGYPDFCQSGFFFEDGYEFVIQISSDEKAGINIVDSGSYYFFYNNVLDKWKVYCDFY